MKLKRSKDRKVTNAVSPNGKTPTIANTFGLPAGKAYSCPGATSVCETVCYAGKLEKIYKGVRETLIHNWNLLKDEDIQGMYSLLSDMIAEFKTDCVKRNAKMLFRIHWDGDFFSDEYAQAWRLVIEEQPDIQFWVYTRVKSAALILKDIPNLSLYYSTDSENKEIGIGLKTEHGIRLAYLAKNFAMGQADMKALTSKPGAKCPENAKRISLIDSEGSACVKCSLCVFNKADIVFSASKK
jgi:curved DNA-binding protein CbpA